MKLALLSAAWLGGTLLGLSLNAAPVAAALLLAAGAVMAAVSLRLIRRPAFPAILAAVMALGLARAGAADAAITDTASYDGRQITASGQIVNDPENAATKIGFRLRVTQAQLDGDEENVDANLFAGRQWLVYANPPAELIARRNAPYFRYGDLVTLSGSLQQPRPLDGFDYPAYLAAQGITAAIFAQNVQVTGAAGARWRSLIYEARGRLSDSLERVMPYPESALASALLLGKRESLPPAMTERFRGAGAAHLLAISGLHVGVLLAAAAGAAGWLLGRRRPTYLMAAMAVIWLYVLAAGAPPSAVRAALLGTVYLAALATGRLPGALPALALAAALMTAHSPLVIRQISFQLSFAAMGGIILALALFGPNPGARRFRWTGWPGRLANWALSLAMISVAATLATWPLVAAHFGQLPLLGVPVSLLAVPALAPAVISAAAAAIGGLILPPLGVLLGWIAAAPATWLIGVVSIFPGLTLETGWAGRPLLYLWYSGLAAALLTPRAHRVRQWGRRQWRQGWRGLRP